MQAQITKAVLSQALLFGIKDMLEACESCLVLLLRALSVPTLTRLPSRRRRRAVAHLVVEGERGSRRDQEGVKRYKE